MSVSKDFVVNTATGVLLGDAGINDTLFRKVIDAIVDTNANLVIDFGGGVRDVEASELIYLSDGDPKKLKSALDNKITIQEARSVLRACADA